MRTDDFPRVVADLDEPLWSIKQAAAYLGVAERTVRRWAKTGALSCLRFGAPDSSSHHPRMIVRFEPGVVRRWASGKGGK